jgi:formylglycine-generating enzyme required for sulfatase activity
MPTFEYVYRDGGVRCYRGSSYLHDRSYAVDAIRSWDFPASPRSDTGFRLVVATDAGRVFRGGSWNNSAQGARVASRDRDNPTIRINDLGFRLATSEELQHAQP